MTDRCTSTYTVEHHVPVGGRVALHRHTLHCTLEHGHTGPHQAGQATWHSNLADQTANRRTWTQAWGDDGYIHIRPDNDLITHTDHDCVCGPTPERIPNPAGREAWMYTHHSLDGREHQEPTP